MLVKPGRAAKIRSLWSQWKAVAQSIFSSYKFKISYFIFVLEICELEHPICRCKPFCIHRLLGGSFVPSASVCWHKQSGCKEQSFLSGSILVMAFLTKRGLSDRFSCCFSEQGLVCNDLPAECILSLHSSAYATLFNTFWQRKRVGSFTPFPFMTEVPWLVWQFIHVFVTSEIILWGDKKDHGKEESRENVVCLENLFLKDSCHFCRESAWGSLQNKI